MSEPDGHGGGELVRYATDDGRAQFFLRAEGGTVWLTQAEIAALFQTTPQNITQHVKSIYAEGEATEQATCKSHLQVQTEGARQVRRTVRSYNLDLILAVGYRGHLGLANGGRKARRVNPSDLLRVSIQLPELEEQRLIADLLDAADAEVNNYAAHLDKLKQEKTALMAQLLTGKRRVRLPAEKAIA